MPINPADFNVADWEVVRRSGPYPWAIQHRETGDELALPEEIKTLRGTVRTTVGRWPRKRDAVAALNEAAHNEADTS